MAEAIEEIAPPTLKDWLDDSSRQDPLLLDVREPWEFALCKIEGSVSIPMGNLISRWPELDMETPIVVICHHGVRSFQVAHFLARAGFANPINLKGGVAAWASMVDPHMPQY